MNRPRTIHCLPLVTLAIGAVAPAGDLNPPAGPILPTHKTLTEVEPRIAINAINTPGDANSVYKINQPGSYYLTGNLVGEIGKNGIFVENNSSVTIDLMGFHLFGAAGQMSLDGIANHPVGAVNVVVVNGTLKGWGGDGIDLGTNTANVRLRGISTQDVGGVGMKVGINSIVTECAAWSCTGGGILTGDGCVITSSTVRSSNGGIGIDAGAGCTISNCSAFSNSRGIDTDHGCTISNCSAYSNTNVGITTDFNCTISNCSAAQNSGDGIDTSSSCTVSNCSVSNNNEIGIDVGPYSMVAECTLRANSLDGIRCGGGCVIRSNTCSFNGSGTGDGAGIHATSTDNRIEGNNCTSADRGIDVDFSGNIVIRNTCSGNTVNWVIVANNVCGPILDRTAPGSAAINGNSAPDSTGSTHPNANFTY